MLLMGINWSAHNGVREHGRGSGTRALLERWQRALLDNFSVRERFVFLARTVHMEGQP